MKDAESSADARLRALLEAAGVAGERAGDCPSPELLVAHVTGGPVGDAVDAIEAHLGTCVSCAAEVEGLLRGDAEPGEPPCALHEADAGLAVVLRELAEFEMPEALTLTLRGEAGESSEDLEAAFEHYRAGRRDEALEALTSLRDDESAPPEATYFRGACLVDAGRAEEGAEAITRAVDARPANARWRFTLAQVFLLLGRGSEALSQLTEAAKRPGALRARARRQAERLRELLDDRSPS